MYRCFGIEIEYILVLFYEHFNFTTTVQNKFLRSNSAHGSMHTAATRSLLDILLQIRIRTKLANVWSKGLIICEALANKVLGTVGYRRR